MGKAYPKEIVRITHTGATVEQRHINRPASRSWLVAGVLVAAVIGTLAAFSDKLLR